jgi:tetratricopeptide (TPR) repeat protein
VWQAHRARWHPQGLEIVTVALDVEPAEALPFIEQAHAQHPSLVDEAHVCDELFGFVNVPNAVWIDETGRIVRPSETAGSSDSFRTQLDRTTKQMSADGLAERERMRNAYFDAERDWVTKGAASAFALSSDDARRRLPVFTDEHVLAAAHFRLGQYLHAEGHRDAALPHLAEARRLHPESWSYRRQTWELEEPGKAGSPTFWAAVDALGERPYYPPPLDMGAPQHRTPKPPLLSARP